MQNDDPGIFWMLFSIVFINEEDFFHPLAIMARIKLCLEQEKDSLVGLSGSLFFQ